MNTPVTPVTTREALLASGGNNYFVDRNTCLHLKLTDPGHPWQYTDSFQRDGMYIEEKVGERQCIAEHCFSAEPACARPLPWEWLH